MTERLKKLKILHTRIYDNICKNGTNVNRRKQLSRCRKLIKEEFNHEQRKNWGNLIEKMNKENIADFWNHIKRIYGRKETKEVAYLKDSHNNNVYEDSEKEKLFRDHWSKVFKISDEENEDFDEETEEQINRIIESNNHILKPKELITQYNIKVTRAEVIKTINSFKQRSPGQDTITKNHLANLPVNMIDDLVNIINSCINLGFIPKQWKETIMIMLPKPGKSPKQVINYRPISLINVPSKVLEKIINNRIVNFIEYNNLNNKDQHGYRKGMGTDSATALIYEYIAAGRANNYLINIVFRDIKSAFDKVWHEGLLGKMLIADFPEYLVRIVSHYLENRTAKLE